MYRGVRITSKYMYFREAQHARAVVAMLCLYADSTNPAALDESIGPFYFDGRSTNVVTFQTVRCGARDPHNKDW